MSNRTPAKKPAAGTKKAAPRAGATQRATRAGAGKSRVTTPSMRHKIADKMRTQKSGSIDGARMALTAAAEVLDSKGSVVRPDKAGGPSRAWQHAATGYCRVVPELNAAKMYYGNCLARVALKVGKRNPDGSVDRIPDGVLDKGDDGKPKEDLPEGVKEQTYRDSVEVINTIRSKIGGQSELMRSYGEKAFLVGESYMLPEDTPAGVTFDVLSVQELSKEGDKWIRHLGPGMGNVDVADATEPIRIWRPDDTYGRLATSSVRACLEILEELVILTRLVRSSAICRMALQGILAISDEFDDPVDENGTDDSEETNPLATDMIQTGATAIDDPSTAAAWLPYILQGPTELIEKGIKFIQFKGDDAVNVVKRREALERLAQGLDLPMEIVLGHQQTTFANAAQISEDTFKVHIEPSVQMFCDAVTIGILWPALAVKAGLTADSVKASGYPDEILTVAVTYDASKLISRPDRTKDIMHVYTRDTTQMTIRITEMRDALGLDPDEPPDEEETTKRLEAMKAGKAAPAAFGGSGGSADGGAGPGVPGAGDGGAVEMPAAQAEGAGVTASLANGLGLAHLVAGAAGSTMERAADKIGAKLRTKLKGTEATQAKPVTNGDLAHHLGPIRVRELLGDDDPASGELASFTRYVARAATEAGKPHPGQFADMAGQLLASAVTERLYAPTSAVSVNDIEALAAVP